MTGKRFEWCGDGIDMWDNQKEERIDSIDFEEAFNELSDENEQLKGQINELQGKASSWKITASEEIINNFKLVKENVKLKSEINMLKNTISRNEAFIERITSKGEWNTTSMKQGDVE